MSLSIQHVRGSESDWSDHDDLVIPDGEIALVKVGNYYKMKIGNGVTQAGLLPFVGGTRKIVAENPSGFTLRNGYHYVFNLTPNRFLLHIEAPAGDNEEFVCSFSFNVGANGTDFEFDDLGYFTGDDTTYGNFNPQPMFHYNVFIFYDGIFQGIVRKTPYEPDED